MANAMNKPNLHFQKYPFVAYPSQPNEIYPELVGVAGMAVYGQLDSSTRRQMFTTQQGQALDVIGADEPYLQTGLEAKYAQATFAVRAPANLQVIKIIPQYKVDSIHRGIHYNSVNWMLYEDLDTGRIGILELPEHGSFHPYFGFPYHKDEEAKLTQGSFLKKDQRILDTANVKDGQIYCTGKNMLVAFMSHPLVAEDGVGISESAVKKFGFYTYENRTVSCGYNNFAVNLYGDESYYQCFPDIGQQVRQDGLLMALRSYSDPLAACEQSVGATMVFDPVSDETVYSDVGGGTVVGITVLHDDAVSLPGLPLGMEHQFQKYHQGRKVFFQTLLQSLSEIRKAKRGQLLVTPELQNLQVEAMVYLQQRKNQGKAPQLTYSQVPLDDWMVQFTIRYQRYPGIGSKLTDQHGGKGVVVQILKDEDMPVDADGRVADLIMDGHSTNNRMNPGRLMEHFVNSFRYQVIKSLRKAFGYKKSKKVLIDHVLNWMDTDPKGFEECWDELMRFYEIVSPEHLEAVKSVCVNQQETASHVAYVLNNDIHTVIPINTVREAVDTVELLERQMQRMAGPVRMRDMHGNDIVVTDKISISELYIALLEKTADTWSAVASTRTQAHGVISQITRSDKYRYPIRSQSSRFAGETETRLLTCYGGTEMGAEVLDRNTNEDTHIQVCHAIAGADKPTNILYAVDRKAWPIRGSVAAKIFKNVLKIAGFGLHYQPYRDIHMQDRINYEKGFGKDAVQLAKKDLLT